VCHTFSKLTNPGISVYTHENLIQKNICSHSLCMVSSDGSMENTVLGLTQHSNRGQAGKM